MNIFWTILNNTSHSLCFSYTLLHSQNLVAQNNITNLAFEEDPAGSSLLHLASTKTAWSLEAETIQRLTLSSLVVEAVSLNTSWDRGQNTYLLPVHVAAWLPDKMIAGFQVKSSQERKERQVKGAWLFMLSPKSGNVTSAHSIHQNVWLKLAHIQGERY